MALHGALSQGLRNRRLGALRNGQVQILVATDVAARGIDVPTITHVFNFGLPMKSEDYTHRIGRTGRAGRDGLAVTFAEYRDRFRIFDIEAFTKQPFKADVVAGLEPQQRAPRAPQPGFGGRGGRGAPAPRGGAPGPRGGHGARRSTGGEFGRKAGFGDFNGDRNERRESTPWEKPAPRSFAKPGNGGKVFVPPRQPRSARTSDALKRRRSEVRHPRAGGDPDSASVRRRGASAKCVIPAQAGIQRNPAAALWKADALDSRLRGNDQRVVFAVT